MKKIVFILTLIITTEACNHSPDQLLLKNIKQLEANNSLATSDTLINSYLAFAHQFPEHPYAIKFMFKAAEANVKAKRNLEGAQLYEALANQYKDSSLAAEALIRAGFNYQVLNEVDKQKRVFNQFLMQFPKHDRVNDIKMSLDMLNYTPAQQDSIMLERINGNN